MTNGNVARGATGREEEVGLGRIEVIRGYYREVNVWEDKIVKVRLKMKALLEECRLLKMGGRGETQGERDVTNCAHCAMCM